MFKLGSHPLNLGLRFILEMTLFGIGVWAFNDSGYILVSWVYLGIVALHYFISFDRIEWLLKN